MKTLVEYLELADQAGVPAAEDILGRPRFVQLMRIWLNQDGVKALLQAAWDRNLEITTVDGGVVEHSYESPDTAEQVTFKSRELFAEVTVDGVVYGQNLAISPTHEPTDLHWQMQEQALRQALIAKALGL